MSNFCLILNKDFIFKKSMQRDCDGRKAYINARRKTKPVTFSDLHVYPSMCSHGIYYKTTISNMVLKSVREQQPHHTATVAY